MYRERMAENPRDDMDGVYGNAGGDTAKRGGSMDLIEVLDRLTNTAKELLDLCKEQAEIIEMAGLECRREKIEEFEKVIECSEY